MWLLVNPLPTRAPYKGQEVCSGLVGDEVLGSWRAAGVPHPSSMLPGLFVLLGH